MWRRRRREPKKKTIETEQSDQTKSSPKRFVISVWYIYYCISSSYLGIQSDGVLSTSHAANNFIETGLLMLVIRSDRIGFSDAALDIFFVCVRVFFPKSILIHSLRFTHTHALSLKLLSLERRILRWIRKNVLFFFVLAAFCHIYTKWFFGFRSFLKFSIL